MTCPHNHLLKTTTITGDIRELSSYRSRQMTPVSHTSSMGSLLWVDFSVPALRTRWQGAHLVG